MLWMKFDLPPPGDFGDDSAPKSVMLNVERAESIAQDGAGCSLIRLSGDNMWRVVGTPEEIGARPEWHKD